MAQTIRKDPFIIKKDTDFLYIEKRIKPAIITHTRAVTIRLVLLAIGVTILSSLSVTITCLTGILLFLYFVFLLLNSLITKIESQISISLKTQRIILSGKLYSNNKITNTISIMSLRKAFLAKDKSESFKVPDKYYVKLKINDKEASLFNVDEREYSDARALASYVVDEINGYLGTPKETHYEKEDKDFLFEGETDKTLLKLRLAVYNEPDNFQNHYSLGVAYLERNRYDKALEAFDVALKLSNNIPELYYNIGLAYMKTGEDSQAKDNFEKAIELNPADSKIYFQLGNIYFKEYKDKQKAEENYKKALELNPSDFQSAFKLGEIYYKENKFEPAIEMFNEFIKLNPVDSRGYSNAALCYLKLNNTSQAIEYFNKAISNNLEDLESHINIARIYIQESRYDLALDYLKEAVKINAEYARKPEYYILLGEINTGKRLIDTAIKNFKKALELDPENPELLVRLAEAYYKSNNRTRAIEIYKKAYVKNQKIKDVIPEDILESVIRQFQS